MVISSKATWEFPLMRDLPLFVKTTDKWSWDHFGNRRHVWVGIDDAGDSWIIKLRGKYAAVDEHVYAGFAQTLGICTQSSVFLILDELAMPLRGERHPNKIPYNAGILKLAEHEPHSCGSICPYNHLNSPLNDWPICGITNPWDKIEARFLGYLCGMSEPTQDLITTSHLWVQIDNELTFDSWAFGRSAYDDVVRELVRDKWLRIDGAQNRLRSLCERISDVSDSDIQGIIAIPSEYRCRTEANRLRRYLRQVRRTAMKMIRDFPLK